MREIVGRYERGDIVPSIGVVKKIADVFVVSPDYLAGEGLNATFDKKNVRRLHGL